MRKCNDLPVGSTAAFDQLMGQHEGSKCSDFIKGVTDWNLKSERGEGRARVPAAPATPRDRRPAAAWSFRCIFTEFKSCAMPVFCLLSAVVHGPGPDLYGYARNNGRPAAGLLRSVSRGKIILCPTNAALQVRGTPCTPARLGARHSPKCLPCNSLAELALSTRNSRGGAGRPVCPAHLPFSVFGCTPGHACTAPRCCLPAALPCRRLRRCLIQPPLPLLPPSPSRSGS